MTTDGTIAWRAVWDETSRITGRPQARWLCETACGCEPEEWYDVLDTPVTERAMAHLDAMLARLAAGEPLQYVLGRWSFRRLDLLVDRRVLIPRSETEEVVEAALQIARARPRPLVCADLGCGSGAIGLSLAAELPVEGVTVWLTDVSDDALDVARANTAGIGRGAANVRLAHGSWWSALPAALAGTLDVVVSNPPYIAADDPEVEPIVRNHEPDVALFSDHPDGLGAYEAILDGAPIWLRPDGWLVMEIGHRQGAAIRELARDVGFDAEIRADASGRDRIALLRPTNHSFV